MIVVPKTYNGDLANLPEALTPLVLCSRWLIWRWEQAKNGKFTKPPYIATDPGRHAANNDPSTWGPYKDAVSAVHAGRAHGIGFSLTGSDYAAIDLDDCRDPETGKIAAWAQDIIDRAPGAYVEITVSGTGLRILGVAAGAEAHRRFVVTAEAGVEVFRKATRYITISGIQIAECAELTNIDAPIDYVSEMYGQPKPNGQSNSTADAGLFDGPILTGNDRSVDFHKLVWSCAGMGMSVDEIERELRTDHAGVIEKYLRPKDRLRKEIERCLSKRAHAQPKTDAAEEKGFVWPEPKPIPAGLQPVDSFNLDFLPEALKPWVGDVSERLQCPPDYVGISAVVALGSVIGRRMGIKPQQQTDWVEIPNVWGCFIGRPGTLKSPAMNEALRFVHRLEIEAAKENEVAVLAYKANINEYKLKQQVKVSLEKARMKKADSDAKKFKIELDVGEEPQEPKPRRYCTNDSSYEALGELLRDNPTGILVERDELISLLKHLDREEQVVARGFYLSGWSGRQSYSFDRIGRGHIHLDAVCLSVLGGTQPARIYEYMRHTHAGGAGGDGLIQRFGLMAWPDMPPDWRDVDRYPDQRARSTAQTVFDNAANLDLPEALKRFADKDQFDSVPYLRFSPEAHADFLGWHTDLERRLRGGDISAALEGHLAKYRKLVPALALINAVADGDEFDVSQGSLARALAFAKYLETHARRVYGSIAEGEAAAARAIVRRIRLRSITDGFTARDILQRDWSHLTDRDQVIAALTLLCDLDHLVPRQLRIGPEGGRPKTTYTINPRVFA